MQLVSRNLSVPVPTPPGLPSVSEWIQPHWLNWPQRPQRWAPPARLSHGMGFQRAWFCSLKLISWFSSHSGHLPLPVTLNCLSSDPVSLPQAFLSLSISYSIDLWHFWCYVFDRRQFPKCKSRQIYPIPAAKLVNAGENTRELSCALGRWRATHPFLSESRDVEVQ